MAIIIILTHMTIFVKYIHQKSKIKGYKEYKNANILLHLIKSLNYFLPIKNFPQIIIFPSGLTPI